MAKGSSKKNAAAEEAAEPVDNRPVVVTSKLMARPLPDPPAKSGTPAVTVESEVMERPAGKKKDPVDPANMDVRFSVMHPRRKKEKARPSIGSTYPQGR